MEWHKVKRIGIEGDRGRAWHECGKFSDEYFGPFDAPKFEDAAALRVKMTYCYGCSPEHKPPPETRLVAPNTMRRSF